MPRELTIIATLLCIGIALLLGGFACLFVHSHNTRRRWAREIRQQELVRRITTL
jgi:hypothetical protein